MSVVFQIGEIAMLKNDPAITPDVLMKLDGEECEVIGGLGFHLDREFQFVFGYLVRFHSGEILIALPHELKKKRPPPSYTGELRIMRLFDMPPVVQPEPVPA